jgi:hypothetical protein
MDTNWIEIKNNKNDNNKIEKNKKTKLCNKNDCTNNNCNFAHNIEELNIIDCKFNINCKQILNIDGLIINKYKSNICKYKHPDENKEQFIKRINQVKSHILLNTTINDIHKDIDNIILKGITNFNVNIIT